jgi:hypothetical protein
LNRQGVVLQRTAVPARSIDYFIKVDMNNDP